MIKHVAIISLLCAPWLSVASAQTVTPLQWAADSAADGVAHFTAVTTSSSAYPSPVPVTGSTNTYYTGDDGNLQAGVARPVPRFTILANTNLVRDNSSGLIWMRNRNYWASLTNCGAAIALCNDLDYGGRTDWRLPNFNEWASVMDHRYVNPRFSNTEGSGPHSNNYPFTGTPTDCWLSTKEGGTTDQYYWRGGVAASYMHYATATSANYSVWAVTGPDP